MPPKKEHPKGKTVGKPTDKPTGGKPTDKPKGKPTDKGNKGKKPVKPTKTEGHLEAISDVEMVLKHGNRFPKFAITLDTPVNLDGVESSILGLTSALEAAKLEGIKIKCKVFQDTTGLVTSVLATTEDSETPAPEPEEPPLP